jgi:hypothetical protein
MDAKTVLIVLIVKGVALSANLACPAISTDNGYLFKIYSFGYKLGDLIP